MHGKSQFYLQYRIFVCVENTCNIVSFNVGALKTRWLVSNETMIEPPTFLGALEGIAVFRSDGVTFVM